MNDPFLVVGLMVTLGTVMPIVAAICAHCENKSRLAAVLLAVGLTAWLHVPWLCWGVQQVWRWNVGIINDMTPSERVEPPAVPTRPSKAQVDGQQREGDDR